MTVAYPDPKKKYSNFVNTLLFLFPIGAINLKASVDLILLLLMFTGVYAVFKNKENPFKIQELKVLSWLTVGYFSVIILSIVVSDKGLELLHFANRDLYFLFAPLIALSIYNANINFYRLILAMKIGLVLMGCRIFYQYLTGNFGDIDWILSHGVLPSITLMTLIFSWININHENKFDLLLTLISSVLAINVLIIAAERGPFLALIVLSLLFVSLSIKLENKHRIKSFTAILIVVCTSLLSTHSNLINRFTTEAAKFSAWSEGKVSVESLGSERMAMFKGGLLAIKENPIFGHGYRNTVVPASRYIENKKVAASVATHNHLHNTFINALVFGGVVALLMIFALLFIPLKKFWLAFRAQNNTEYAFLGILLISGYTIMSATSTMFGGVAENAFFVFFLSILLPKVISGQKS